MTTVEDLCPMLGVRVAAGPLELRGITDDHLPALGELALDIHDADRMPFYVAWSTRPAAEIPRNTAQYHWRMRASLTPERWELALGVWYDGELAGCQSITTQDYLVTRTGETGSWLGRRFQGRGIGTAMRRALCAFCFDHLDAVEVTSAAFLDNPASLAVSRKVGYREDGTYRTQRREGEVAVVQRLTLAPEDLVRGPDLSVTGVDAFRRSIGLD